MNAAWHPDADLLADVAEELADSASARRVEAHLTECANCHALREGLESVTVILGSQPIPRMPEEVSARVLAALAAEPQPMAGAATVARLSPARVARRRGRLRQGLAAAAAVAAIVGVGTVGVTVFREAGVGRSASDDSASSTSAEEFASGGGPAGPAAADAARSQLATGRAYTPGNLAVAAALLVSRGQALSDQAPAAPSREAPSAAAGDGDPRLGQLRDPAVLSGCVSELTGGRQAVPLIVDFATYEGRPAAVVVVPSPSPDRLDVFVVGPRCSSTDSDLIASTSIRR